MSCCGESPDTRRWALKNVCGSTRACKRNAENGGVRTETLGEISSKPPSARCPKEFGAREPTTHQNHHRANMGGAESRPRTPRGEPRRGPSVLGTPAAYENDDPIESLVDSVAFKCCLGPHMAHSSHTVHLPLGALLTPCSMCGDRCCLGRERDGLPRSPSLSPIRRVRLPSSEKLGEGGARNKALAEQRQRSKCVPACRTTMHCPRPACLPSAHC